MTTTLATPGSTVELNSSFSTRRAPWIVLGTQIDDEVNAAEAAKLGGLDFEVELRPAMVPVRRPNDPKRWNYRSEPSRRTLTRVDNDEFFDYVSSGYQVVQYADAFDFLDEINSRYTAAGIMNGGKQGFVVVQLPGLESLNVEVDDDVDPHELYVIVRTSHDRSKAVEISVMPLRGKCMNMLPLPSFTAGAPQRWSIKHIGDPKAKLAEAQAVLKRTPKYAEVYANTVRQLSSVSVSREELQTILKRVLPNRARRDDQIEAISNLYVSGDPTVGEKPNGWTAVQAVNGYFQWYRNMGTRTAQSLFTSGLTGDQAKYTGRTTQLLLSR